MNNASNLVRKITVRKTSLRNVGIARVIVGALWLLSIPATAGMLYYAYQSSIWHSQVAVASSMHIFMMVVVALTPIMLGVLSWIFSRLDSFIS